MNIFHKLMDKLGRYRSIPDRRTNLPYMDRYYLFLKDRKTFPFNVTLHVIKRSDDPIMHDHPWPFMTIILRGGYWEHTPVYDKNGKMVSDTKVFKGPGSIIRRSASELHWLELENEQPATTLFFMGPHQREWGFIVKTRKGINKWVRWDHYLNDWKAYHEKHVIAKQDKKQ